MSSSAWIPSSDKISITLKETLFLPWATLEQCLSVLTCIYYSQSSQECMLCFFDTRTLQIFEDSCGFPIFSTIWVNHLQTILIIIWYLIVCSKYSTHINSTFDNNIRRYVLFFCLLYRWINWGPEKIRNWPRHIAGSRRARIWAPELVFLTTMSYCLHLNSTLT